MMTRSLDLFMLALATALVLGRATPDTPAAAQQAAPQVVQIRSQPGDRQPLTGKVYTPPRPAFDFALPASSGQTVRLSDYQGRIVLLFFGYTSCPDVCPTTLADIKGALTQLGDLAQEVVVLFITVDPARDTLAHLHDYLGYFHEASFVGLRSSEAETAQIAYAYGAKFYREDSATATGGYSVAHTTRLFLINRQGQWAMTVPHGATVEQLAANLRYWLTQ